ncbi:MAG TPA: 16S rRNA (cytidine(1402)-2'-O)-methyltransferase [Candidatus Baltobacteraceae bacterium]|jgi:16S rRNA (cytidine1402-2'-O)-methyltransferase|nr:16S rRNA (cytidine(1402)-2'-O)-methyltransferase [Candidatus Baltobacteraceae bacterium]
MPLVFVPTPLGNLGDITLRALETLRGADLVVAEDTRVARHLLHALKIASKELWSYREQNAAAVTGGILERAREQLVAVVSDAGMPGISDPGTSLVAAAREAGVAVDVLPGPSAALGVAVLSGFSLRRFAFEGFPPRSSRARRECFRAAFASGATTIWYESPQRIRATLDDLAAVAPGCGVFLVREYTKKFEQQLLGTPAEIASHLEEPIRGEISFAVAPVDMPGEAAPADPAVAIDALLDGGRSVRDIARELADRGFGERRDLYNRASARKHERGMGTKAAAELPKPQ